jgi:hypothetical protein
MSAANGGRRDAQYNECKPEFLPAAKLGDLVVVVAVVELNRRE